MVKKLGLNAAIVKQLDIEHDLVFEESVGVNYLIEKLENQENSYRFDLLKALNYDSNISGPLSPSEKIFIGPVGAILTDIDTEIETLQKKLAKYKQVKQGLMQNLLTGKIRLLSKVERRPV